MKRLAAIAAALILTAPAVAAAHPLGNFTVNQYARIDVAPAGVGVFFVLDQAEIPTFQFIQQYDANGSGTIDGAEAATARSALVREILPHLALTAGGRPVRLAPESAVLTFPAGQGGLRTLRLELRLHAAGVAPGAQPERLGYATTFADGRIGWREIVVTRAAGSAIVATTANLADHTNALRSYPRDLLASPLDQRTATVDVRLGSGGLVPLGSSTGGNVAAEDAGKEPGGLASLLDSRRPLSLGVVIVSLLLAAGFGMIHALSPGHGKSMVAAYLAGTRGTARHALALGATVTVAHTSSVFALGLVTISLSAFVVPDHLYPWLNLVSGLMVLSLGTLAIRSRLRRSRADRARGHDHGVGHPDGGHGHGHDHGEHGHGHGHSHADPPAGGLSWRALLALGVSGGMIPCPSALVVLLSAIALHRVAFGLLLIVAFSFGLAAVISGIGLAVLYTRQLFGRIPSGGRAVSLLPVVSGIAMTAIGVGLTLRALPSLF